MQCRGSLGPGPCCCRLLWWPLLKDSSLLSLPCPHPSPCKMRNRATPGWSGGKAGSCLVVPALGSHLWGEGVRGAPAPTFWKRKGGGEAGSRRGRAQQPLAVGRSAEQNSLKKHWEAGFRAGKYFVPPGSEGAAPSSEGRRGLFGRLREGDGGSSTLWTLVQAVCSRRSRMLECLSAETFLACRFLYLSKFWCSSPCGWLWRLEGKRCLRGAGWSSASSPRYALKAHCSKKCVSLEICSLFLGLPGKPFTLIT